MAQWYYAEGPARNVGPVSSQQLADLFRNGHLMLDTPVWRDGMAQWQPLREVVSELGLDTGDTGRSPPPLPPLSPQAPPRAFAPEPRGMSRGMITLIVCAALVVPCISVTGILAAIALPAYQDYLLKSKASESITAGTALKPDVQRYVQANGTCPSNGDPGFKPVDTYAARYVEGITVGEFDDGTCGVEVQVHGTEHDQLDGHAIWLWMDPKSGEWNCSSDIDDKYLPTNCRG